MPLTQRMMIDTTQLVQLAHSAVKTYFISYDQGILCNLEEISILDVHFISIFEKNELVYLHTPSVVTYCHLNKPDKFKYLTRKKFYKVFPNHRSLSYKKTCFGFRVINKDEFSRIIRE